MLRISMGTSPKYCDGQSRRSFLQVGMAGMGALTLPQILRSRAQASDGAQKSTSVILIWLDGGPGHMDLYDLKPQAPAEYRGIWNPIPTNVPGFEISELFPRQAKVADKFSLVRSLHHGNGDHFAGAHMMLTGRWGASGADTAPKAPSIAAMAVAATGSRKPGVPAYVGVPYSMSVGIRPGYFGSQYVGMQHNPFETGGDPNNDKFQVQNISLPQNVTVKRLEDRALLAKNFDRLRRDVDHRGTLTAMDEFDARALDLVTGEAARKAFDISSEDPALRERYGRHSWGQSVLLARRLVEAGSTFVTVHFGGWDHHWNLKEGMERLLPIVDNAVASLFEDLAERGLSDDVLVVLCGEFSRTPRMNDGSGQGTPGRDHWGNSMFCLLGGGGVKGGRIVGSTTRLGDEPHDRPLTPPDIHHTIYHVLGVDPHMSFIDHSGRPITALEPGEVIGELL